MQLDRFRRKPLMGILRGITTAQLAPTLESAISGGLEALEITMNTPGAAELIARARAIAGGELAIGAGTVLSRESLDTALAAGASFIVMPTLVPDVVGECVRRDVPVFPGALTPQEIHTAWQAGAAMVKVFPSKFFGPEYFREVKGPFDDVLLTGVRRRIGRQPRRVRDLRRGRLRVRRQRLQRRVDRGRRIRKGREKRAHPGRRTRRHPLTPQQTAAHPEEPPSRPANLRDALQPTEVPRTKCAL